jgi:hypothetical protein
MAQPAFAPAALDFPALNFPLDPALAPHFPAAACPTLPPDAPPAGPPAPNHPGAAQAWGGGLPLPGPVNGLHGGGGVAASFGPAAALPFGLPPPAPPAFPPAAPAPPTFPPAAPAPPALPSAAPTSPPPVPTAGQAAAPGGDGVAATGPRTGPVWARNRFKELPPAIQELIKKGPPGNGDNHARRRNRRYQKLQQQ